MYAIFFDGECFVFVVFEEQWNKQLSSVSLLHAQFWRHAIINCYIDTLIDHYQVLWWITTRCFLVGEGGKEAEGLGWDLPKE